MGKLFDKGKEYWGQGKEYYGELKKSPDDLINTVSSDIVDSQLFDTFAGSDSKQINRLNEGRGGRLYKSTLKFNQDKAIDDNIKITGEGVSSPALQKKIDEEKLRVTNAATASYNKSLGSNLTGELQMKSAGTSMGSGKLPVGDNVKKSGSQIGKHMNKYGV
jgi:hypothetical protein